VFESNFYLTLSNLGGARSLSLSSATDSFEFGLAPGAAAVPEPSTWGMLLCGVWLAARRRRRDGRVIVRA
jgi:hypothetical protein